MKLIYCLSLYIPNVTTLTCCFYKKITIEIFCFLFILCLWNPVCVLHLQYILICCSHISSAHLPHVASEWLYRTGQLNSLGPLVRCSDLPPFITCILFPFPVLLSLCSFLSSRKLDMLGRAASKSVRIERRQGEDWPELITPALLCGGLGGGRGLTLGASALVVCWLFQRGLPWCLGEHLFYDLLLSLGFLVLMLSQTWPIIVLSGKFLPSLWHAFIIFSIRCYKLILFLPWNQPRNQPYFCRSKELVHIRTKSECQVCSRLLGCLLLS